MESNTNVFDEQKTIKKLKHYLPQQASLKDFVHHNTLHAFQNEEFHSALKRASVIFGFKTYLSLDEYRQLFSDGKIDSSILKKVCVERNLPDTPETEHLLFNKKFDEIIKGKVGVLRDQWKTENHINLDKAVHSPLFRLLSAYLDQGIAIWSFPQDDDKGLLDALRDLERNNRYSLFNGVRARRFLLENNTSIKDLLSLLVKDEALFEQYLFDQQFSHPGWSGLIAVIEHQETLLDHRIISLSDIIYLELLLEIDTLDTKFDEYWKPISLENSSEFNLGFTEESNEEVFEVLAVWQEAFEWTYYDEVLAGIQSSPQIEVENRPDFQAFFCIDDREYSFRRNLEMLEPNCQTYGTPGFFGVEFYFRPEGGKFYTKACPAPVNPKFLIKEENRSDEKKRDAHFNKRTHLPFQGFIITQTLGFWSALKLLLNVFRPSLGPSTAYSFQHMDKQSKLSIEFEGEFHEQLQIGFTLEEMCFRVLNTLKSIGLVENFSALIYIIGHGASSTNNTHYAGYDCGACCGRPGAVNARVFSYMANLPAVREELKKQGVNIPETTYFLGGMHDTTRDEIEFYDEQELPLTLIKKHQSHQKVFEQALEINAKERSRQFDTLNNKMSLKRIHKAIKKRSVSLFEPRPELNHATNALCIVGRASLTKGIFLDRRPFMNSYDYRLDPDGKFLLNILNAAAPVCGGINLEYYFSRVDNEKLGAGTKLPHNVVGLIAVSNGVEGDLRPGLPSQMIEVHDPIRLMFVIEQIPDLVLEVIQRNASTYEWFKNEWVILLVKDPISGLLYYFKNGKLQIYTPLKSTIPIAKDLNEVIENTKGNIPVLILN